MSIGGDEYGERDRTGEQSPAYGHDSGRLTTRTRLPEGEGGGRSPVKPGRSMLTVVAVVVLLIAAIAFANQGGGDSDDTGDGDGKGGGAEAQPTAPTGEKPVAHDGGGIPSGFPHTKQGAESAAANYAVALGGDGMFNKAERRKIVQAVADPDAVDKLQAGFDADYNKSLNKRIGLDDQGRADSGSTFVNRTVPAGTSLKNYDEDTATVSVWCAGLFGVAGEESTNPVMNTWFTVNFKLTWTGDDWKVTKSSQKDGPTPVSGDSPVSGAKEIGEAVDEYGGFTYAR